MKTPQIDISQTKEVICEACGGIAFVECVVLRRVSAIVSGTGKEGFFPVTSFGCLRCGIINQEFLPSQLRTPKITT
jgi:hypothetical protein